MLRESEDVVEGARVPYIYSFSGWRSNTVQRYLDKHKLRRTVPPAAPLHTVLASGFTGVDSYRYLISHAMSYRSVSIFEIAPIDSVISESPTSTIGHRWIDFVRIRTSASPDSHKLSHRRARARSRESIPDTTFTSQPPTFVQPYLIRLYSLKSHTSE